MISRLPDVDDFIEKVKTAPNNQLYPSWELQLKSNAYKDLLRTNPDMAQKLSDWIIMKNDDLTFKPGPVFVEEQNKLTGNVIIKDLVYNYGFSNFIK